jgi:GDP-L-fucose synthase
MDLKNTRILVTGINDLIGMHLLSTLRNLGAVVTGIGDLHADLGSLNYLENEIIEFQPKMIFHVPGHRYGIAVHHNNPGDVYYESIVIFSHMLEAARKANVSKIINVLSNCVYPEDIEIPYKEKEIWMGLPEKTLIPHGMARRMSIIHGNAYRAQHGIKTLSVILASVYGPNDNFDPLSAQVLSSMIRRFIEAKQKNSRQVVCWGSGSPTREFIHVRDAVTGLINAGIYYDSSEPINIGTQVELSIKKITEIISTKCGFSGEIVWDLSKPDGRSRVCLDCSLMRKELPKWEIMSFESGIEDTISWYNNAVINLYNDNEK